MALTDQTESAAEFPLAEWLLGVEDAGGPTDGPHPPLLAQRVRPPPQGLAAARHRRRDVCVFARSPKFSTSLSRDIVHRLMGKRA